MNNHSIPETAKQWLLTQGFGDVIDSRYLHGGSICTTRLIFTISGHRFAIKTHSHAPVNLFISEAESINTLQHHTPLRVPTIYCAGNDFLLMEYIEPGEPNHNYWELLAKQVAVTHQNTNSQFGFHIDNYCGETLQINTLCSDGYTFFAECRLNYQAQLAFNAKQLTSKDVADIAKLSQNLESLIPEQPPSLVHGDFWSGNLHCDEQGNPAVLDPACYWGWREADIAMSKLFNGFDLRFYQAYQSIYPMDSGWEERIAIYNLYHLLNHLNLFGGSYLHSVRNILRQYT